MLSSLVSNSPVFLLVFARCFATILSLPLFSSRSIPRAAKAALAGYIAFFIFPGVSLSEGVYSEYAAYISLTGDFSLDYVFLLLGEAMLGVILGFFVQLVFATFSAAGQFFSFQTGLSASEVYDSESRVENPVMGQLFNFMAVLVFLQNRWVHAFLLDGMAESFRALNVFSIINNTQSLAGFMVRGLSLMFKDALIIALPIMASLFLINVTIGILARAAPQMNLLTEGFPILMLAAYLLIFILVPYFSDFFESVFGEGLGALRSMFDVLGGGT